MPKPVDRNYDPEALGAKCRDCPLNCKSKLPVPPQLNPNPRAVLILECPGGHEKYRGENLVGNAGKQLVSDLKALGVDKANDLAIYNRIACCPPEAKRTESMLRKAATACLPRLQTELQQAGHAVRDKPRLYLGKWAPVGLVTTQEYKAQIEIKLMAGIVHRNSMWLQHPQSAYFHAPGNREVFRTHLTRFIQYTKTGKWPAWNKYGKLHIEPTQEALVALRAMGDTVAADIETIGCSPITDPISAIGISDGKHTVALGYHSYENKHGYHTGLVELATHNTPQGKLAIELLREIKHVLETRTVVGHNLTYDLLGFRRLGIYVTKTEDTLDAWKTINPSISGKLEDVAKALLPLPTAWKTIFRGLREEAEHTKGGSEFTESPREALLTYNAKDALVSILIWRELEKLLAIED